MQTWPREQDAWKSLQRTIPTISTAVSAIPRQQLVICFKNEATVLLSRICKNDSVHQNPAENPDFWKEKKAAQNSILYRSLFLWIFWNICVEIHRLDAPSSPSRTPNCFPLVLNWLSFCRWNPQLFAFRNASRWIRKFGKTFEKRGCRRPFKYCSADLCWRSNFQGQGGVQPYDPTTVYYCPTWVRYRLHDSLPARDQAPRFNSQHTRAICRLPTTLGCLCGRTSTRGRVGCIGTSWLTQDNTLEHTHIGEVAVRVRAIHVAHSGRCARRRSVLCQSTYQDSRCALRASRPLTVCGSWLCSETHISHVCLSNERCDPRCVRSKPWSLPSRSPTRRAFAFLI